MKPRILIIQIFVKSIHHKLIVISELDQILLPVI